MQLRPRTLPMHGHLTPSVGLNLVVAMTACKQPINALCRAKLPVTGLMPG